MADIITQDALFFFDGKPVELSLYECLAKHLLSRWPGTEICVQKTQISFCDGRMFACVSLTPVKPRAARPEHYITVSFGLEYPLNDPRALAVQVRPNRYTHHVIVGDESEIDKTLLDWIDMSHVLATKKRRR